MTRERKHVRFKREKAHRRYQLSGSGSVCSPTPTSPHSTGGNNSSPHTEEEEASNKVQSSIPSTTTLLLLSHAHSSSSLRFTNPGHHTDRRQLQAPAGSHVLMRTFVILLTVFRADSHCCHVQRILRLTNFSRAFQEDAYCGRALTLTEPRRLLKSNALQRRYGSLLCNAAASVIFYVTHRFRQWWLRSWAWERMPVIPALGKSR